MIVRVKFITLVALWLFTGAAAAAGAATAEKAAPSGAEIAGTERTGP